MVVRHDQWAVHLLSMRVMPVEVNGPIFYILRQRTPRQDPSTQSVSGPYRRKDPRFRLLPRGLAMPRITIMP